MAAAAAAAESVPRPRLPRTLLLLAVVVIHWIEAKRPNKRMEGGEQRIRAGEGEAAVNQTRNCLRLCPSFPPSSFPTSALLRIFLHRNFPPSLFISVCMWATEERGLARKSANIQGNEA